MTISNDDRLALYRALVRARAFEEGAKSINDYYHCDIGEEAVTVGSTFGLRHDDTYVAHYRGAMAASAMRGASMHRLLAGMVGKETAYDRGHFFSEVRGKVDEKNLGCMGGALGLSICYGTGAALSAKMRKTDEVAVIVFGDGCANKGEFHEALNLAGSLNLPAIFVCKNNQFCISVSEKQGSSGRIADRGPGYGMPGEQVDGNDVEAVSLAITQAIERARSGGGPSLIEALTYRVSGHWATDEALYQSEQDRAPWLERDPVKVFTERLQEQGLLDDDMITNIRKEADAEVKAAIEQVMADPLPTAAEIEINQVYAP